MRLSRLLTPVALSAAAVAFAGAPASAATTPDPDVRTFIVGPICADGTFSGTVRVASTTDVPHPMRVEMRYNTGGANAKAYPDGSSVVGTQSYRIMKGVKDYDFSIDASSLPAGAVNLIAYAIVGTDEARIDTGNSRVVAASSCALPASSAAISSVSIDCNGDLVTGNVEITDPPTAQTLPLIVALHGRAPDTTAWTGMGSGPATVDATTTTVPFEFPIGGKHTGEYRIRATLNNGAAVFSEILPDATCDPAAEVPEAPAALLLPVSMALGAGVVVLARRRSGATPVAP